MMVGRRGKRSPEMEKSMLTKEQKDRYLESPNHCPYCEKDNILAGKREYSSHSIFVDVECLSCGEHWNETYNLGEINE